MVCFLMHIAEANTSNLPALMYTWWTCCCCFFFIREYCLFSALMSVVIRSIIMLLKAAWYSLRQASIAPGLSSAILLEPRLCSSLWSMHSRKRPWETHQNVLHNGNPTVLKSGEEKLYPSRCCLDYKLSLSPNHWQCWLGVKVAAIQKSPGGHRFPIPALHEQRISITWHRLYLHLKGWQI